MSGGTGGPECTLRDAIAAAETDTATGGCPAGYDADTILLPPGEIVLTEVHTDELETSRHGPTGLPLITTEMEILGDGTTIRRAPDAPEFRIFYVSSDEGFEMSGVVIRGGKLTDGEQGAGMLASGLVTLIDVDFEDNEVLHGDGGALQVWPGTTNLENVNFSGNVVGPDDASHTGAAIYVANARLIYETGRLTNNRGSFDGGSAVVHVDEASNVSLRSVVFEENEAAAIWNQGRLGLQSSTVASSANQREGGVVNEGEAEVEESIIRDNSALMTGGVYNTGTFSAMFVTVENNSVTGAEAGTAGGVANVGGTAGFNETTIRGNSAAAVGSGGGIFNSGTFNLANSGVIGNEAPEGAGIYLSAADGRASLEMEMTGGFSIRENRAADNGGGIYVDGPALLVMEDPEVWIHLNVADADGDGTGVGGGIYHTGLAEGSLIREEDVFDNVPDDIFGPPLP